MLKELVSMVSNTGGMYFCCFETQGRAGWYWKGAFDSHQRVVMG
jgi:hypothetical protein